MSVLQQMETELKTAMKNRDQARLDTIRLIKTAVKNKEIELIHPLSDAEFIAVLSTMAKQRRESIESFKNAGRTELAAKEEAELVIIESFLPKALSESEVTALIAEAKAATNATGPKDMGAVMKYLKDKTAGRVDGKILSEKVKTALAG